jgi:glycosyltransferase involved in cell wall biosynthesis
MEKISAVIITLNEEKNIVRCLQSLQWANEIVVVDSGSADGTVEICKAHGARVIEAEWQGFGPTKRFAVEQATHDWIFSIDADEEVTPALREKIRTILRQPDPHVAYRIKRQPFYLGQPIHHCGWQKDYPLRLFNRRFGNFNSKAVHEAVQFDGAVRYLQEPLNHYTYPTISSHVQKMDRYTTLSLDEMPPGKKASIAGAVARSFFKFFKMYFLKLGFLDGRVGFVLCANSAIGIFFKYIKLWERNRS